MVWVVVTWKETEQETICNACRVSNIMPWDYNAGIQSLQAQIDEEVSRLEKLTTCLNMDTTQYGRPNEKLHNLHYLDMVNEKITKARLSTLKIVHLVQSSDYNVMLQTMMSICAK